MTRRCNDLLLERTTQLERNNLNGYIIWFYNSTLHIKLVKNGPIHKIFHPEKVLGVDKILMNIINNVSF